MIQHHASFLCVPAFSCWIHIHSNGKFVTLQDLSKIWCEYVFLFSSFVLIFTSQQDHQSDLIIIVFTYVTNHPQQDLLTLPSLSIKNCGAFSSETWKMHGSHQPCSLSFQPLFRERLTRHIQQVFILSEKQPPFWSCFSLLETHCYLPFCLTLLSLDKHLPSTSFL